MAEAKKTTRKKKATKKDEAAEATTVAEENNAPEVEIEPVKLTINDLQAISAVIDVSTQRGAFKANELSQVGAVFDRLNAFLKQVSDAAPAESEEGTAEGTE